MFLNVAPLKAPKPKQKVLLSVDRIKDIKTTRPGSPVAINRNCLCPTEENCYGKGLIIDTKLYYWIHSKCKLHGT